MWTKGLCSLLLAFAAAVSAAPVPDTPARGEATITPDELAIYDALLASWLGKKTVHQRVDWWLSAAPSKDDLGVRDCAKGVAFSAGEPRAGAPKSLVGVQFDRPGIELVDGSTWAAADPERGIAAGKSVRAAVRAGFNHSLMSFSQIAFGSDRAEALVSFGMVCGTLCGSGATVHMIRRSTGWVIADRCSQWVS